MSNPRTVPKRRAPDAPAKFFLTQEEWRYVEARINPPPPGMIRPRKGPTCVPPCTIHWTVDDWVVHINNAPWVDTAREVFVLCGKTYRYSHDDEQGKMVYQSD